MKKSRTLAIALCLAGFLGIGGLHRFYVKKNKTALLYLFTFGVFGIGTIVDLVLLLKGSFTDVMGYPLLPDNQQSNLYQSSYQQSTSAVPNNATVDTVRMLKERQDDIISTEIFNPIIVKGVGEHSTEIEFKVSGVTFENRQSILKDILNDGVQSCILKFDTFNGEPCIPVLVNHQQIGYIPKNDIDFFLKNKDKIRRSKAYVYKVDDIYCAKLYVTYYTNNSVDSKDNEIVFVNEKGLRYHKSKKCCNTVLNSMTRLQTESIGLEPCKRCCS